MSNALNARIRTSQAVSEADDRLPCRWCNAPTLRTTLSEYGARCFRCYEAWRKEPIPGRNWQQAGEKPSLAELVSRLETRVTEGENLNPAQREWLAQAKRKMGAV